MNRQVDFVRRQREAAWEFGRQLRDGLLGDFSARYQVAFPPPPAIIIDELLTDFLDVDLKFDPLPEDTFAKAEWLNGRGCVTVNSLIQSMPGVKDAQGVENIGKWHEAIHIVRNADLLKTGPQATLPGIAEPPGIACYRSGAVQLTPEARTREFWAEEAGRAAAISYRHLARSESFKRLMGLARLSPLLGGEAWGLLYRAAADIGVNRTALVKQLEYEGWITVTRSGGRNLLSVQPALADMVATS